MRCTLYGSNSIWSLKKPASSARFKYSVRKADAQKKCFSSQLLCDIAQDVAGCV